jgi:glycosyltransferase involved in cell wall biosynthesis
MSRVLLVCYYFPPLGLAGVSRPLNLFRHLPTYGYDCHVLTVKPVAYRKYSPELLHGLDITKIFRSGSRDPQRLMYLLGIREVNPKTIARGSKFGETLFPDSKVGWVNAAVRLGKKLHSTYRYDAVISTSPPISAHLVGMRLANETGLKWVADFRDPWTVVPLEDAYSSEKMKLMGQTLKKQISESASAMTAVNQAVADYIGTINVISNGFDPEVAKDWGVPTDRGKFLIGLLGSYSDEMPLEPLFRVVRRAIESGRIEAKQITFIQVGDTDSTWIANIAAKYGLNEHLTMHGLRPREETVMLLSHCAMMYAALSRRLEVATTSRIFDMLASGRPILAYAAPEGELARQLTGSDHCVFEEANGSDAVQFLISRVNRYMAGELEIVPTPDYSLQHAWPRKAEQFAELLRRI